MKVCSGCQRCYPDEVVVCHDELSPIGDGAPEMVPGYLLTRLISTNRYIQTFLAEERTSSSDCVIKIFSPPDSDRERILRDAMKAKALFNPGLVDIYDAEAVGDGRVFIVGEKPDGQSLRELLNNVGQPDLLTSIEIVRQAAETLHSLHETGLVHGAISPENIFLSSNGSGQARVRIANIDLGRFAERSITSNKFEIDDHIESLRYFSPEQCGGDALSNRTDVYSLGVVFYELLAGAPPFDAARAAAVIEKHRSQRPPDVRIDNFELRMLVTHALLESLQKQPDFRQSSAGLFARQLRHIQQLATHTSTPPPAVALPDVKQLKPLHPAMTSVQPLVPAAMPSVMPERRTNVAETPAESVASLPKPTDIPNVVTTLLTDSVEGEHLIAPAPIEDPAPVFESVTRQPSLTRSRLKLLKRKLHELSSMVAARVERATIAAGLAHEASEHTDPDTSQKKPRKIEWIQPEDDIPSAEDVLHVLAEEERPPSIALTGKESKARAEETIERVSSDPEKAATTLTPVTVPSPPAVEQVATADKPGPPSVPSREPQPPSPKPASAMRASSAPLRASKPGPVVVTIPMHTDDEEITLVRPPGRRIKVDLRKPRTIYRTQTAYARSADDITFQPTLLGAQSISPPRTPQTEISTGMFAAHFGSSASRSDMKFRVMTIGSGAVVLAVLFLFANDAASRFFQNLSPGDSVTAQAGTSATENDPTKEAKPKSMARTRSPSAAPAAKPKREMVGGESKPKPKTDARRSLDERVRPSETSQARKTVETQRKRAESGSPKPKTERRAETAAVRPSGSTRPRIVRDPQP